MALDPTLLSSTRLGQLPSAAISLSDNMAHEVDGNLKRATIQELSDFIANYASTIQGVGFRPANVQDGQTLPNTIIKEFILVGKGTYYNVNGGSTIVLNKELNALVSNGSFWSIGVEIPVNVELAGIVQTIRSGFLATTPSENALFDALSLKLDIADLPPTPPIGPSVATGLSQGALMTINTDATKFDIAAGFGYIINGHSNVDVPTTNRISFAAKIANFTPNISTQKQTYVAIDVNGDLYLTPIPLSATERRNYVRLGVLIHLDNTNITHIYNQPTVNIEVGGQVQDILDVIGFTSKGGNRILPVGNNLKIKKELGKAFKAGANFSNLTTQPHSFILAAQDPITFRYRTQTGVELSDTTDINPGIYDLNGTFTAMPSTATFVSIQRVYIFQDGVVRIQPGQRPFVDLNTAINNLNSDIFITDSDIENNGLYLGAIAVTRNNINLTTSTECIFIPSQGTTVNGSVASPPLGYTAENAANKQNSLIADGSGAKYPTVDAINLALTTKADLVGGLVPQNQLPSYVDDVLEFADLASFPSTGEIGKIYIAISPKNLQYRWTGSAYIQITNGLIASTNDVSEGSNNLYFLASRVLSTILSGLSTASTSVITAADSILSALGKLQGQVSINNGKISFDNTSSTRLANTSGANTGDQTLSSLGAAPSSGSANYIQNGTSQQTANLNINGSGVFGSSVTANSLNISQSANNGAYSLAGFPFLKFSTGDVLDFGAFGNTWQGLRFFTQGAERFSIANNGSATFASSVTATSHVTTGGLSTQLVKGDGALTVGYKVYTALLNQSGTAAPVATVLENTLGGTVVWSRTTSGIYFGTLSSAFTNNKTFITFSGNPGAQNSVDTSRLGSNTVQIITYQSSSADDNLLNGSFEIRVYN